MDLNVESLPLILLPGSANGAASTTQGSEQIRDLGEPWEYVELPGSEIKSGTTEEGYGQEVASVSPPVTNDARPPTPQTPEQREKDIYGIRSATEEAYDRWLVLATGAICSEDKPGSAHHYRDQARSYGLLPRLERRVLIRDIETSPVEVQDTLSQNVVLLLLNLVDHRSDEIQIYLGSDRTGLISKLVRALCMPSSPKGPKDDDVQTTSLVRALLEMSGGKVDHHQHAFSDETTAAKNAALFASVFESTEVKEFGTVDAEMITLVSESRIFSESTSLRDLHDRIVIMRNRLRLGFEEGHLNLPPQVVRVFGIGEVHKFHCYLSHTYGVMPALRSWQNNQAVLLTWAMNLSGLNTVASRRQLDIVQKWARSDDGSDLYDQMVRSAQDSQSVHQLALTIIAMVSYSRLVPDNLSHSDWPLTGSYLTDLNTHFGGHALEHRGSVVERMAFAMIRTLSTLGDRYEELTTFLVTVADREPPVLHVLDGLSDQYFSLRVKGCGHKDAFHLVMTEVSRALSGSNTIHVAHNVEGLHTTNAINDTVCTEAATTVSLPAHHRLEPLDFPLSNYRLACLSNIRDNDVMACFVTKGGQLVEVPKVLSIEPLGDGSYEVVVMESHCDILQDWLNSLPPGSKFELDYDPAQPTDADLQLWGDERARELRHMWFLQRAIRIIREGSPFAAAYYARRLELLWVSNSQPAAAIHIGRMSSEQGSGGLNC